MSVLDQVPPDGPNVRPKYAIVGEAPGEVEAIKRKPFVGSSGTLLNAMLGEVGILRDECYVTNLIKYRPEGNNFSMFYEDSRRIRPKAELLVHRDELRKELLAVQPDIVITLGSESLRALTSERSIERARGFVYKSNGLIILPTYHPTYVLRDYSARATVQSDFAKASRIRALHKTGHNVYDNFVTSVLPTYSQVMDFLSHPSSLLALDIETIKNSVRCLGLSFNGTTAISVPFILVGAESRGKVDDGRIHTAQPTVRSYWTQDQEYNILAEIAKIFADPSIRKVAQNFSFDGKLLAKEFGFVFNNFYMDTMVAHWTCYPELPKGLDYLASIYVNVHNYCNYNASSDHETQVYNCFDACVTWKLVSVIEAELANTGSSKFYFDYINPLLLKTIEIESRGITVDHDYKQQLITEYSTELVKCKEYLVSLSQNSNFNPDSPKQVADLLYTKLGLRPVYDKHTGNVTVNKFAIDILERNYPSHAITLDTIRRQSSASTIMSTFLSVPTPSDGKLRTHYNVAGTVTGRLSSSEPLGEVGMNLQNIPRGVFRRMFIAEPNHKLIKADLSQAEFRIVVWLAKIDRIIKLYMENPRFDIHKHMASLIFNVSESEVTKYQRTVAKNGVYGGNYGMGALTASRTYKMDYKSAEFVLKRYRDEFPEIQLWWQEVQGQLYASHKLVSPFGRQRIFFGRMDNSTFQAAYSHSAQCIVADVINRALLDYEHDPVPQSKILLQVHDEIVIESADDAVQDSANRIKQLLERPIEFGNGTPPLVIPADVSCGINWYDQAPI